MAKILFIVSGATYWVLKDGTRYATGYWAEEFANPYKIITEAGHEVVVGTPNGVTPNVELVSVKSTFGASGADGGFDITPLVLPLRVHAITPNGPASAIDLATVAKPSSRLAPRNDPGCSTR